MDSEQFDQFLEEVFVRTSTVLASKSSEYSKVSDKFHNFHVAAAFNDESPEKALWGMLTKHLVSLSDMIKVESTNYELNMWDEKLGDAINYLVLLWGIVTQKSGNSEPVRFEDTFERPDRPALGSSVKPNIGITQTVKDI